MFSPLVLWPCFPCIMKYQLCMPHGLATANRHDHAWTDKWAKNISTLSRLMSLMRPWYAHRQGDRRGHLYGTEGTWINYPTCFPWLNEGFMTILRRAACFILIWTCSAVLTDHRQLSFSKLSRLQNETHKNKNVVLFAAMLFFETMSVELHGRSHPAPKLYEGDLLSGSWTLWVSRVEGVQGFLRGSRLQRSNKSKVLTIFKGSRAQGL